MDILGLATSGTVVWTAIFLIVAAGAVCMIISFSGGSKSAQSAQEVINNNTAGQPNIIVLNPHSGPASPPQRPHARSYTHPHSSRS